jgi:hypothetical protein
MTTSHFLSIRGMKKVALGITLFAAVAASSSAATFQLVAKSRQTAVKVQGKAIRFGSFGQPTLNDSGNVAFYSTMYGGGVSANNNVGIFIRTKKRARLLAQEGVDMNLIGTGGFVFPINLISMTNQPVINKKSNVYWSGTYEVFLPDGTRIFETAYNFANRQGKSLAVVTVVNTQPGTEPVADFNANNSVSLLALDGRALNDPLSVARCTRNAAISVVSVGDTIIGMPLGTTFTNFGVPTLDDKNQVYFSANASGTAAKFDGIWFGKNGDPDPLVVVDQEAPGANGKFATFADLPGASPRGDTCAFLANAGTNGIWTVDVKTRALTLIAKDGTLISNTRDSLSNLQTPAVNDAKTVVFLATPSLGGIPSLGIFMSKTPGTVEKVIAVGDTIKEAGTGIGGEPAKVIDIRFSSLGGLNKKGQIVCTLSFDNRSSGVYIITP